MKTPLSGGVSGRRNEWVATSASTSLDINVLCWVRIKVYEIFQFGHTSDLHDNHEILETMGLPLLVERSYLVFAF